MASFSVWTSLMPCGNVPLSLHEDGVDFRGVAVATSILTPGPGAPAWMLRASTTTRKTTSVLSRDGRGGGVTIPLTRFRDALGTRLRACRRSGRPVSSYPIPRYWRWHPHEHHWVCSTRLATHDLRKQSIQLVEQSLSLLPSTVRL
jgi:hypothetical protein